MDSTGNQDLGVDMLGDTGVSLLLADFSMSVR